MARMRWAGHWTVLGLVLACSSTVAAARGLATGTIELAADTSGLTRDIDRRTDISTTGTAITFRPGYFVTDDLEIVGSTALLQADQVSAGGASTTGKTMAQRLGLDYHFPLREGQEIYPFVHGSLGYASTTSGTGAGAKTFQGATYAIGAGLKIFLTDTSALRIALTREQFEGGAGREITALALGYAIYFGTEQIQRTGAKQVAAILVERETLENKLTLARQNVTESAARLSALENELTDTRQAAAARERTLETELANLRDLVRAKDVLAARVGALEALLVEARRPPPETTSLTTEPHPEMESLTAELHLLQAELLKAKGSIAELEAQLQARREREAKDSRMRVVLEVQAEALFEPGNVELAAGGRVELDRVLDTLRNVKGKRIVVEAHSDNVPVRGRLQQRYPTNWELSAARAMNVVRYLETKGVPPALLSGLGYGEHAPIALNDTEVGRRNNRRMRIILMPIE